MSVQDFLDSIRHFEEQEAHYAKLYAGFSNKLPNELVKVVFEHLSELNNKREENIKAVHSIAVKYVDEIWETFNQADGRNAKKDTTPDLRPVCQPQTKEDAEKKLRKEIKVIPDDKHKLYEEIFWESYEEESATEQYKYAVFIKMKEVFAEFYLDDLLKLDGPYLRYFDRSLGLDVSLFLEEVYELL